MACAKTFELLAVSDSRNEFPETEATLFLNGANLAYLVDECVQVRALDPLPIEIDPRGKTYISLRMTEAGGSVVTFYMHFEQPKGTIVTRRRGSSQVEVTQDSELLCWKTMAAVIALCLSSYNI